MKLLVETALTLGLLAAWIGIAVTASDATRSDSEPTARAAAAPVVAAASFGSLDLRRLRLA